MMNRLFQRLVAMGVTDAAVAVRMIEQYKRTGKL